MKQDHPKTSRFGPTQKDIAKALALSQACVAIALNPKSKDKLPSSTVALIEAKARELNYRPQHQARILRSGRSHTIGVVCMSGEFTYHAPQERVKQLARCALRAGYQLIAIDMNWFEGNIAAAQDYLLSVASEGIIFCNLSSEKQTGWQEFTSERSLPCVSMSSTFDGVDQVQSDMRSAFRDMTLHHIEQGSRRLHLVLPFHDTVSVEKLRHLTTISERVAGFVDAIRSSGGEVIAGPESGRAFDLPAEFSSRRPTIQGYVHYPLRTELCEDVFDVGYHETRRLLQTEKADSLVCSNDDIAAGAVAACSELGLRIPEDIRVSGADNSPFARYCGVPLTTIEQSAQSLAEWSIHRIVELIENPRERNTPKTELFPCELIFRRSTVSPAPQPGLP